MSAHAHGEWVELKEDHHGYVMLDDELFFYGHCSEADLDWGRVMEEVYDQTEDDAFDAISDDELFERARGRYTTDLEHVYGRKIPVRDEPGYWTWQWQREPGRGAFPVTRVTEVKR